MEASTDHVECGRREVQESNILKLFTESEKGPVAAQSPNCTFDDSGDFLIFPSWKGIVIADVATGKVRKLGSWHLWSTLLCILLNEELGSMNN